MESTNREHLTDSETLNRGDLGVIPAEPDHPGELVVYPGQAETAALLEVVLHIVPGPAGVHDGTHEIVRCNNAGYSFRDGAPGEDCRQCYRLIGRSRPCQPCAAMAAVATGEAARVEWFIAELGIWVDARAYPVFDGEGGLVKIVEQLRDITAQKQAEEASRLGLVSEHAVSEAAMSIARHDEACVEEALRIMCQSVSATRAYVLMVGAGGDTVEPGCEWCAPGTEPGMARLGDLASQTPWFMERLRRGERIAVHDVEALPAGAGQEILAGGGTRAMVAAPIFSRGTLVGVVGLDDTTRCRTWHPYELRTLKAVGEMIAGELERRRIQTQLLQAERLAGVGLVAAGVAHEINNPLTYVLYNLDHLQLHLPGLTRALSRCGAALEQQLGPEALADALGADREVMDRDLLAELTESAQEAAEGAVRIKTIVQDLKMFSRVEQDRQAPVSLNQVIDSAANMAKSQIKHRARLVKEYGSVPEVSGSEGRLCQVFLNLLVNAAQAMDEGAAGQHEIRVRTWTAEGMVMAEVSDDGCGIDPGHLDRLFDPLFSTKPAGEGSGLGLAICRDIITAHGGRIEVHSEPGRGARFRVRLPAREGSAAPEDGRPAPRGAAPGPACPRGRILVVDDEGSVRRALERVFAGRCQCVTAGSGDEARRLLAQETQYDVILCDLMMRDGSGVELYGWIEQHRPTLAERTLFITGGAVTAEARSFLRRFEERTLHKPFDMSELIDRVESLLPDHAVCPAHARGRPPEAPHTDHEEVES